MDVGHPKLSLISALQSIPISGPHSKKKFANFNDPPSKQVQPLRTLIVNVMTRTVRVVEWWYYCVRKQCSACKHLPFLIHKSSVNMREIFFSITNRTKKRCEPSQYLRKTGEAPSWGILASRTTMKMVCVKVQQLFLELTRRSKKLIIIFLFVVSSAWYAQFDLNFFYKA